jgi:hypothetical protein
MNVLEVLVRMVKSQGQEVANDVQTNREHMPRCISQRRRRS